MASITIRNLDENTKKRLRLRAAVNGRSVEAEARDLLDRSVLEPPVPKAETGLDLFREIRAVAEQWGGFDLEPFPRERMPKPRVGTKSKYKR
ncbi:MAG TPA: hypothetical protein VGU69_01135 [Rhizomicrobium sp.]|nr:hypothetical protein [Rhizomicrobium sp.]